MKDFWRILEERGYTVHRKGAQYKFTSIIAPFGKRPIRLDNLGKGYSEDDILERIQAARNGIKLASPSELPKKQYRYQGSLKNIKPKKLKGFQALYFRYLYLFKKIRRKKTPQRVSFFMREELLKLERYQKQFRFLMTNNIETGVELSQYQKQQKEKIDELTIQRKMLQKERTDENCEEIQKQITQINKDLTTYRCNVRLCKAIFQDAYRIAEKKRQADALQKQADKEMMEHEHKRRSR